MEFKTPATRVDFASNPLNTAVRQTFNTTEALIPEGCMELTVSQNDFIPWDNPDNLVSRQVERSFDTTVAVIFLPLLLALSVPTNLINMAIFWKQGLKERINVCLFSLSLTDLLYMVFSFLFNVDRLYLGFNQTAQFGPVLKFLMSNLLEGFRALNFVSGFISTVIACERCLCVVSPLRSQAILKAKTTAVIIVLSYLVLMAGPFAAAKRWSFVCVFDPVANITSEALVTSTFYLENKTILDFLTLLFGSAQPSIYLIVVLSTTIVTAVKLKRIATWREQTSSAAMSSREVALTRMLIGASVVYVICSLPPVILGVLIAFMPDVSLNGRYYNLFNLMISLFELFSYINSTFNFFVYCFLGSKYKETLREMFCCRKVLSSMSQAREVTVETKTVMRP